jgi:hypothetical protein
MEDFVLFADFSLMANLKIQETVLDTLMIVL